MAENGKGTDDRLLEGVSHESLDPRPFLADHAGRLAAVLSDPAVRSLIGRYGARLGAEDCEAAGAPCVRWFLTLLTPVTISFRAAGDRVLASAQGLGWASGASARDALINLARELREEVRRARNDVEVGRWFSEAWPGLSYSYSTPEWKRRLLPALEETLLAVEGALRATARRGAGDTNALPA